MLNIVFSVTDSYVDYMGTTIYSIKKHHPNTAINFYVLTTQLSKHSLCKLKLLGNDKVSIQIVYMNAERFSGLPLKENITIETYFRLLLSQLLPNLDRVLYLDADTLVTGEMESFYYTDFEDNYVVGVNERDMLYRNSSYREQIGFSSDDVYVNAGVLLLNLKKIREDNIEQLFFDTGNRLKHEIQFQDQDILNISLKGKIKSVSSIYNFTSYEREVNSAPLSDVRIIHFNWHKPWKFEDNRMPYNVEAFTLYQEQYQLYLNLVEPQITIVVSVRDYQNQSVFEECIQTLQKQLYKNIKICVLIDENNQTLIKVAQKFKVYDKRIRIQLTKNHTIVDDFYLGYQVYPNQYIAFVEVSEHFDVEYISGLYEQLVHTDADIAVSSFVLFNQDTGVYSFFDTELSLTVKSTQFILENAYAFIWYEKFRQYSLSGKLYRLDSLKKSMLLGKKSISHLVALQTLLSAKEMVFTEPNKYVKRQVHDDLSFVSKENVYLYLAELQEFLKLLAIKQYQTNHYLSHYQEYLLCLNRVAENEIKSYIEQEINVLHMSKMLS